MPIVVFLHGSAYVRGSRSVNTEVYGNVATYFARQGILGVNGTSGWRRRRNGRRPRRM